MTSWLTARGEGVPNVEAAQTHHAHGEIMLTEAGLAEPPGGLRPRVDWRN